MRTLALGETGLEVSEIGIGCWQLGGRGWGRWPVGDTTKALELALARGVTLFDTAPVYGFGLSEERLGRVMGRRRDRCVIVTKGGLDWDDQRRVRHDARPASLRRQLEGSLRRLGVEQVDVYLLHWPDPEVPLAESLGALAEFRREGLISAWGLSNFRASELRAALESPLAGEQPPVVEHPVNVLDAPPREHADVAADTEAVLAAVSRARGGVIAFDVLARGLLTSTGADRELSRRDVRRGDDRFDRDLGGELLEPRARLERLAAERSVPLCALAVRAALDRTGVNVCLVGVKTPEQLEENLRYAELPAGVGRG